MLTGLIGRKSGMTRVFREDGKSIPVTVVEVLENRVTQVKTEETDGYAAVQVTTGEPPLKRRFTKALQGHFAKAKAQAGRGLWEFNVAGKLSGDSIKVGDAFDVTMFEVGQFVDVAANSKGRGFAGVIKRHNFGAQRNSHGNSLAHRAPGSIGQCQTPGRVMKGKKMAGRMGNTRVTIQNLEIVQVDKDNNILLVKGAVPGAIGSDLLLQFASKKQSSAA